MTNTVTYYLRYDLDENRNVIIQNESFDYMITDIMNKSCGLKLTLIDRFGIVNSKTDDIVNEFVHDCKERDENRYCPYLYDDDYEMFPIVLKNFISGLLKVLKTPYEGDFDVFNSKTVFRVDIPSEYVSDEKREEFLGLGPDYLIAQFSQNVIVENVLPAFYLNLFNRGKLSEKSLDTNLRKYKIGLH